MKKILLFLCALVCSAAMSAKTIYLNTGGSDLWEKDGATFKESISGKAMTAVPNVAVGTYYVEIDDAQTTVHFQRIGSNGSDVWNETADLSIPEDKNLCTITGWSDGTWSVYAEEVVDPSTAVYEIKHGWKDGSNWSYKTLNKNEDGTYSLRDIYGGTGCNWKSTYIGEKWIANPTLVGEPQKGDSAIFTLTSTEGDGAITITKIDNGGDEPGPTPSNVVYFVPAYDWGATIYCYAWTGGNQNATWPGVAMVKEEDHSIQGVEIWKYTSAVAYENVIFTCGNDGCKTTDLSWTEGMYYDHSNTRWLTREELESTEPLPDVVTYGIGSNKNSYKPAENPMTVVDGVATCTITLGTEEFQFAVVETRNGVETWLKNTQAIVTREANSVILASESNMTNTTLTPDKEGDYVFTFTIANSTLVVTYPMDGPTSISSAEAEVVTTKVICDGQVLIIRDGIVYNMMGQAIR